MALISGLVPKVFAAPVTATNLVLLLSNFVIDSTGNSAVSTSNSAHLTVAPFASAACTHGRIFES